MRQNNISAKTKDKVYAKTNNRCAYCGCSFAKIDYSFEARWTDQNHAKERTIDHIVPKSAGGSDETNNLVACCRSCNSIKRGRTMDEFRHFVGWMDKAGFLFSDEQVEYLAEHGFEIPDYGKEIKFYYEEIGLCL